MKIKIKKKYLYLMAVILVIIVILLLLRSCGESVEVIDDDVPLGGIMWDTNAESGTLSHLSEGEIRAELNEKVSEGMINISMNLAPVFENGAAEGNLLIVNSEINNFPQVVYIIRKDTGEEIYRSGGIPVGSKIERAKLTANLPAGTYDCLAYFNSVDSVTGAIIGTACAEIAVTVRY